MQAATKTVVINMTFVCHGQDCNSILLGPATSGANELIVFRSHSICNFQFKIGPTGKVQHGHAFYVMQYALDF